VGPVMGRNMMGRNIQNSTGRLGVVAIGDMPHSNILLLTDTLNMEPPGFACAVCLSWLLGLLSGSSRALVLKHCGNPTRSHANELDGAVLRLLWDAKQALCNRV
jgi:hypothetical protein